MNFKSQLEWFYTLPNLVKTTSGFPKIKWQTAPRAKANLARLSQPQQTEAAIAKSLYTELQGAAQGQVILENWTAFLSRHSEKAAKEVKSILLTTSSRPEQDVAVVFEETLLIGFTFAAEPKAVLESFEGDRYTEATWYRGLHGYCRKTITGKLIDYLRTKEGSRTFMRTNLGLAARATETRIKESLTLSGIQNRELEQYQFVWRCFIEVKNAYKVKTSSFTVENFQQISDRIQELEEQHHYALFFTMLTVDQVKNYLEQTGKAIRYLIDRPTISIDKSVSATDSTSMLDLMADDTTKNDLDFVEQNTLTNKLKLYTNTYLDQIDPNRWLIWFLKELIGLKQTEIAGLIGTSQKTVSKNYRKAWQHFLSEIISEFQSQDSDSPQLTSEAITDLKEGLIDLVKNYFLTSFQAYLRSLNLSNDQINSQHLQDFLQNRSNKKLNINPDIQHQLDTFMENSKILTDDY